MRFAELFAGAGGLSLGLERAGWSCVWHAEIAEQPRAILKHRWPEVPLYGDVLQLDGKALTAAHGAIDLLTGGSPCQDLSVAGKRAGLAGARSGLFYEQMRLWDETGADLCLWENVDGARSSNAGKDFGAVLSAFVGGTVAVPRDGWRSAGVAAGPGGVAAWRVLDAQFFGVPQRRRRVFVLGTRTGRIDPAEVLSLAEGVRGDSTESREAGEVAPALPASGAGTARTGNERTECGLTVVQCFDSLNNDTSDIAHTLRDPHGTFGDALPAVMCLTGDITHALTHEGHDASEDGTGRGTPIVAGTLAPGAHPGGFNGRDAENGLLVVGTLNGTQRQQVDGAMTEQHGVPRRLTPRECERLMAWPDDWTLVPDAKGKPLSDAARYKACGNGVAAVHSHWIGWRLALALNG